MGCDCPRCREEHSKQEAYEDDYPYFEEPDVEEITCYEINWENDNICCKTCEHRLRCLTEGRSV
jgi:hypothetical protein